MFILLFHVAAAIKLLPVIRSSTPRYRTNLCLDLLAQDVFKRDGISSEFRDTLAELLDSHLVLVEVEAEVGLVIDVALLLKIERAGVL